MYASAQGARDIVGTCFEKALCINIYTHEFITLNIYCSWLILSSDNSRFLGCFRFFWTDLLHAGSGLLMLRFITSPNIALSRKMKGKNNVLNKLDNRNIAIK